MVSAYNLYENKLTWSFFTVAIDRVVNIVELLHWQTFEHFVGLIWKAELVGANDRLRWNVRKVDSLVDDRPNVTMIDEKVIFGRH